MSKTTTTSAATETAAPIILNPALGDMVDIKRGNRSMPARITANNEAAGTVDVILKSTKSIQNLPKTSVLAITATGKAAAETEGFAKKDKVKPKTERAVEILLAENGNGGRRHVMNLFIKEFGMQESTANTYYYLAKSKAEEAGHTIPAYVKAVQEAAPEQAQTPAADAATA